MRYYYDLHIHTVLSPCADVLMTPNNIFNMASLKGLHIIAITDHNSAKQLPICHEIAKSYDLLFIPGIEVSVAEGFHVLCYFKTLEEALKFDHQLENYLNKDYYDLSYYGEQSLTDIEDQVISNYPYLLSQPTNLSFQDLLNMMTSYETIMAYAHIDRSKHSGLSFIHKFPLDFIECTKHIEESFIEKYLLNRYKLLTNSDAHQIIDISECTSYNSIHLDELTIEAFFRYFHHG